jgi:uncharacterized protein (TIGR02246 family)
MRAVLILAAVLAATLAAAQERNRDFDFEFGAWTAHISRLVAPLSDSDKWVEYSGSSVVRPVWNGRANLGELLVEGPTGTIEGMSLRVFDPERQQWRIHWANARTGLLGEAMVGGFTDGVGLFYNEEEFEGRTVLVRFVFSDITQTTFSLEQAFSPDGGESWEPNWVARFEREAGPESAEHHAAALWAAIDDAWNARDAGQFASLFAEDAVMEFVDRGERMASRDAIRVTFAARFPEIAPEFEHRSTVTGVRAVAHGVLAVDGGVEVLRHSADEAESPEPIRSFRVFSLLSRTEAGWAFREMRIYLSE